ncbi:hypothetical protein C8N40_101320 [Pontibacter mucosus]|uniref:Uncharacterized protein n=2 Tax=Pontibacter mucosus TaxID=1649266 RepID=A0A2T5YT84_9BACT|nr:hypothetical protein C8N40_101320 [Pontibacter mucosus]
MSKSWGKVREFLPMAAVLLLCMLVMPATQAYAEDTHNGATTTTVVTAEQQTQPQPGTVDKKSNAESPKKPATSKPQDKSVLDAEVLESPLAYFRNAFTPEDEESDAATGTSAVVVTIKALIATLLSTVM